MVAHKINQNKTHIILLRLQNQAHLWQSPRSSNSMDLPMLLGIVQALQGALSNQDKNQTDDDVGDYDDDGYDDYYGEMMVI